MAFDTQFSPGKWGNMRYTSQGVGGAAGIVNAAAALQNIKRNSPDYQGIFNDNIVNRANLRNTVRDINSNLISQKILGKAEVAGGDLIVKAHERGADKIAGAHQDNIWKSVVGMGANLLLGGIF